MLLQLAALFLTTFTVLSWVSSDRHFYPTPVCVAHLEWWPETSSGCICNSISYVSKKLATGGGKTVLKVKLCVNICSLYEADDLFRLWRGKHTLLIVFCLIAGTMWWTGEKRKAEEKTGREGESESVSTATLIDILQVEQLSSGLTAGS